MADTLLSVRNLNVSFETPDGIVHAVRNVGFDVAPGEVLAIVGESGSGKSQAMMAIMGLLARNGRVSGSAYYDGKDMLSLSRRELNRIRGVKISMIFQEPMTALDPLYPVGRQILELLAVHSNIHGKVARDRAIELLTLVRLPDAPERLKAYPHELSGGQRQRVMIAMALANNPDCLIADEPTTALDVTIQAEILVLLARLKSRFGMSIIFITHNLGIVRSFSDRVLVMRDGHIVETGTTAKVFSAPQDGYTKMLLAAEPQGTKAAVHHEAPAILSAQHVSLSFHLSRGLLRKPHKIDAVNDVSLSLLDGQTIGIVGESGSGKSTLGRILVNLLRPLGHVVFNGTTISGLDRVSMRPYRRNLQMVFQDPYGALSPRMTVGAIISEGLLVHRPELTTAQRAKCASEALIAVGLNPDVRNRFPHEFSGGQRQRIAIARSLILQPTVMVLDEPTSALDRSVQKQIIALLLNLQNQHDLSYVFISHDLAVIQAVADYVVVMKSGQIVEEGPTEAVFGAPGNTYTKSLLDAALNLNDIFTGINELGENTHS
ncbi:MAG: ABC transporter ATP-binding protein [Pseudomonadota bacterium]